MAIATFDPVQYKTSTRAQWQDAAEAWHRWGPQIEQWLGTATELMLDLAKISPGDSVLDVAAGTGGQTLAAARRVGPAGHVLAVDISPNILEYAAREAQEHGLKNVTTRETDGENLTLADSSFNAVISRVGLIYFPDQARALEGMHRVLKPGGRIGAIVYSTPENNKFFSLPVSIIRRRAQLPPPQPGQPGPFSLGNPGTLAQALERAGFKQVETRSLPAPLRMSSAAECVRFERESFGALHQMLSGLSEGDRQAAWAEIEASLNAFQNHDHFEGPCELVVGVGVKPV